MVNQGGVVECCCNLAEELRGHAAAAYLRDHLVEARRPPSRLPVSGLVYECPRLHTWWESNGLEGEDVTISRVGTWFPVG